MDIKCARCGKPYHLKPKLLYPNCCRPCAETIIAEWWTEDRDPTVPYTKEKPEVRELRLVLGELRRWTTPYYQQGGTKFVDYEPLDQLAHNLVIVVDALREHQDTEEKPEGGFLPYSSFVAEQIKREGVTLRELRLALGELRRWVPHYQQELPDGTRFVDYEPLGQLAHNLVIVVEALREHQALVVGKQAMLSDIAFWRAKQPQTDETRRQIARREAVLIRDYSDV